MGVKLLLVLKNAETNLSNHPQSQISCGRTMFPDSAGAYEDVADKVPHKGSDSTDNPSTATELTQLACRL